MLPEIEPFETLPPGNCVQATLTSAAAAQKREPGIALPQETTMPPFPREALRASCKLPIQYEPAPDAGAEDDSENMIMPRRGACASLCQSKAVSVISNANRPTETSTEEGREVCSIEAWNICGMAFPGFRILQACQSNVERKFRHPQTLNQGNDSVRELREGVAWRCCLDPIEDEAMISYVGETHRRPADIGAKTIAWQDTDLRLFL
ncbi:hypothetical protein AA0535_2906 [Asaia krungthepensis NRIC 0535]|uniref:Uncharacterized protein n=1 Tax=Asaia krungthepensis NRIC 0535 TaxID=1307925 RepID=A0ABQ0Q6J1_9PROT|nr:hypothetical protein AA0535_2906 [Asaia krungthepensis NRIC 0535]